MLRSYRRVFLAIAGLILVGASPSPSQNAKANQHTAAQSESGQAPSTNPAPPEQSEAARPDPGCERGKDQRTSDLCAQWKAADAAYDAAVWGWWQLIAAWIGLILGGVTMGAAIAAAIYAKRAAVATEDTVKIAQDASEGATDAMRIAAQNADAASELAKITREGMRKDRAWLCPETLQNIRMVNGAIKGESVANGLGFGVVWANYGNVPAVKVGPIIWIETTDGQTIIPRELADEDVPRGGIMGPGNQQQTATVYLNDRITDDFRKGVIRLLVMSKVIYADAVAGGSHQSTVTFQVEHQGGTKTINGRVVEAIIFRMIESNAS